MGRFELSEQWSPWSDIDGIFCAASAAIDFGPLDPVVCEVVFNEEFDPVAADSLEQAWEDMHRNPNMMSMDITLSHIDADAACVTLSYSGRRLRLSGRGSDWDRAKAAYDAAQGVLAGRQGPTAPKLPTPPVDPVAETRRRLVIEGLEAALRDVDSALTPALQRPAYSRARAFALR